MYGSAIPRVTSKHPGPQPPPEISHCDCAGVNCTQKKAWRPLDGDLESSDFMRSSGSLFGFICAENRPLTWFLQYIGSVKLGTAVQPRAFSFGKRTW